MVFHVVLLQMQESIKVLTYHSVCNDRGETRITDISRCHDEGNNIGRRVRDQALSPDYRSIKTDLACI